MDLRKIYETVHLCATSESDSDYDGLDDFDDVYLKNRPNPIDIEEINKRLVIIKPMGNGILYKQPSESINLVNVLEEINFLEVPYCYIIEKSPKELTNNELNTLNAILEALGKLGGFTLEISKSDSKIDVVLKMLSLGKCLNEMIPAKLKNVEVRRKVFVRFYDILDLFRMLPVNYVTDEASLSDIQTMLQSINLKIIWGNFFINNDKDDCCNIINDLRRMYQYLKGATDSNKVKPVLDLLTEVYVNISKYFDCSNGNIDQEIVCYKYLGLLNILHNINKNIMWATYSFDEKGVKQIISDMESIYGFMLDIDDHYSKYQLIAVFFKTYKNVVNFIFEKDLDDVENCPKVDSISHIKIFEKKAKYIMSRKSSQVLDYDLWSCLDNVGKKNIQLLVNQHKNEFNINIYTDSFEVLSEKLNELQKMQNTNLYKQLRNCILSNIWLCALNELLMGDRPKFFNYFLFSDVKKTLYINKYYLKTLADVTGINVNMKMDSYDVFIKKLEEIEIVLKDYPEYLCFLFLLKDELEKVPNKIYDMYCTNFAHNSAIINRKYALDNVYPNFKSLTKGQKQIFDKMLKEVKIYTGKVDINSEYLTFVKKMTKMKKCVNDMKNCETRVKYLRIIANIEYSLKKVECKSSNLPENKSRVLSGEEIEAVQMNDMYPNFKFLTAEQRLNIHRTLKEISDVHNCKVDVNVYSTFVENMKKLKKCVYNMKNSENKVNYLQRIQFVENSLGKVKSYLSNSPENISGVLDRTQSVQVNDMYPYFKFLTTQQKLYIQQLLKEINDVHKCEVDVNKDYLSFIENMRKMINCVNNMENSNTKANYLERIKFVENTLKKDQSKSGNWSENKSEVLNGTQIPPEETNDMYPNFKFLTAGQKLYIQQSLKEISDIHKCEVDVNKGYSSFVENMKKIINCVNNMENSNTKANYLEKIKCVENGLKKVHTNLGNFSEKKSGLSCDQPVQINDMCPNFVINSQQSLKGINDVHKCEVDGNNIYLKHCVNNMEDSKTKVNDLERIKCVEKDIKKVQTNMDNLPEIKSFVSGGTQIQPVQENDLYPNFKFLTEGQKLNIQQSLKEINDVHKCEVDANNSYASFIENMKKIKHCVNNMEDSKTKVNYLGRIENVENSLRKVKTNLSNLPENKSGVSSGILNQPVQINSMYPNLKLLTEGQIVNIQQSLKEINDVHKCEVDANNSYSSFVQNMEKMKRCVNNMEDSKTKVNYLDRIKCVENSLKKVKTSLVNFPENKFGVSDAIQIQPVLANDVYPNFKFLSEGQKSYIQQSLKEINDIHKCEVDVNRGYATFVENMKKIINCVNNMENSNTKINYLERIKNVENCLNKVKNSLRNPPENKSVVSSGIQIQPGQTNDIYPNFKFLTAEQKLHIQRMLQKIVVETKCTVNINNNDYRTFVDNFNQMKHCVLNMEQSELKALYLNRIDEIEEKLGATGKFIEKECHFQTKGQNSDYRTYIDNSEKMQPYVLNMEPSESKEFFLNRNDNVYEKLGATINSEKQDDDRNQTFTGTSVNDVYPNFKSFSKKQKQIIQQELQPVMEVTKCIFSFKKTDYSAFVSNFQKMKRSVQNIGQTELKESYLKRINDVEDKLGANVTKRNTLTTSGCIAGEKQDSPKNQTLLGTCTNDVYFYFNYLTEGQKLHIQQMLQKIVDVTKCTVDINNSDYRTFVENFEQMKRCVLNMEQSELKEVYLRRIEHVEKKLGANVIKRNTTASECKINYPTLNSRTEGQNLNIQQMFVDNSEQIKRCVQDMNSKDVCLKKHYDENAKLGATVITNTPATLAHISRVKQDNPRNQTLPGSSTNDAYHNFKSLTEFQKLKIQQMLQIIIDESKCTVNINNTDYRTFVDHFEQIKRCVLNMEESTLKETYLRIINDTENTLGATVIKSKTPPVSASNLSDLKVITPRKLTPNQRKYITNCLDDINRVIKIKNDININSDTCFAFMNKFYTIKRNVEKMLQTSQKNLFLQDIKAIEHILGLHPEKKPTQKQQQDFFLLFQYYQLNPNQKNHINAIAKKIGTNIDVTQDDYFTFHMKLLAMNNHEIKEKIIITLQNVKNPPYTPHNNLTSTQKAVTNFFLLKLNSMFPLNFKLDDFSALTSKIQSLKTTTENDNNMANSKKIMVAKLVAQIEKFLTNNTVCKSLPNNRLFIRYLNLNTILGLKPIYQIDVATKDFSRECIYLKAVIDDGFKDNEHIKNVVLNKFNYIVKLKKILDIHCHIETVEDLCNQFFKLIGILVSKVTNTPYGLNFWWIGFNDLKLALLDEIQECKEFLSTDECCIEACDVLQSVLKDLTIMEKTYDAMIAFQDKQLVNK